MNTYNSNTANTLYQFSFSLLDNNLVFDQTKSDQDATKYRVDVVLPSSYTSVTYSEITIDIVTLASFSSKKDLNLIF